MSKLKKRTVDDNENLTDDVDKYTFIYRLVKTFLMILAWVSFGTILEMIGCTLEDIRILLNLNYNEISFGLVVRGIGYMISILFSGVLYDKLPKYAETIMAVSSFFMALPNLLMPWIKNYVVTIILFLVQGLAYATYDLGGNHIVLGLWKGINESPINAMHAGYGIGAIISVQIAKPFIMFDPLEKYRTASVQVSNESLISTYNENITYLNSTTKEITSKDIKISIPYFLSALIGFILSGLFIFAQVIEIKNTNAYKKKVGYQLRPLREEKENEQNETSANSTFIQRLLFGERQFKGSSLIYMLTQIFLLTTLLLLIQGYITVISRFMLTYLTKGPAKFDIDTYSKIQTFYWAVFVASRFIAAFIGIIVNPIVFVLIIIVLNMLTCLAFLVPYFTQFSLFFWIAIGLMGFTSGPMQPSSFVAAKKFLVDYNSFVLSLFSIGMSFGIIIFQQLTGLLLDTIQPMKSFMGFSNFESAYVVSYMFFLPSFLCFAIFIPICVIYKKYVHLVRK